MIEIVEFDRRPVVLGQQRELILAGDGPFTVSTSCFVENPPPAGFRPCAQCSTSTLQAGEPMIFEFSREFWGRRTGSFNIEIRDTVGEIVTLRLAVISDSDIAPTAASSGAA